MKLKFTLLAFSLAVASTASATVVDLTFEGIPFTNGNTGPIGNYYNGGAGPNYGITFSPNSIVLCYNTPTVSCSNTSRGGFGDPHSQTEGLDFADTNPAYLTDAAGFTTGFSLFYSSPFGTAVGGEGLEVFSGPDGTGSLLASLTLTDTPNGACNFSYSQGAEYCPFEPLGVSFSGVAESIVFTGRPDFAEYDDITFGSVTPGPTSSNTPEPSSFILLFTGAGAIASEVRRRMKRTE
jgi:hypothetical protein